MPTFADIKDKLNNAKRMGLNDEAARAAVMLSPDEFDAYLDKHGESVFSPPVERIPLTGISAGKDAFVEPNIQQQAQPPPIVQAPPTDILRPTPGPVKGAMDLFRSQTPMSNSVSVGMDVVGDRLEEAVGPLGAFVAKRFATPIEVAARVVGGALDAGFATSNAIRSGLEGAFPSLDTAGTTFTSRMKRAGIEDRTAGAKRVRAAKDDAVAMIQQMREAGVDEKNIRNKVLQKFFTEGITGDIAEIIFESALLGGVGKLASTVKRGGTRSARMRQIAKKRADRRFERMMEALDKADEVRLENTLRPFRGQAEGRPGRGEVPLHPAQGRGKAAQQSLKQAQQADQGVSPATPVKPEPRPTDAGKGQKIDLSVKPSAEEVKSPLPKVKAEEQPKSPLPKVKAEEQPKSPLPKVKAEEQPKSPLPKVKAEEQPKSPLPTPSKDLPPPETLVPSPKAKTASPKKPEVNKPKVSSGRLSKKQQMLEERRRVFESRAEKSIESYNRLEETAERPVDKVRMRRTKAELSENLDKYKTLVRKKNLTAEDRQELGKISTRITQLNDRAEREVISSSARALRGKPLTKEQVKTRQSIEENFPEIKKSPARPEEPASLEDGMSGLINKFKEERGSIPFFGKSKKPSAKQKAVKKNVPEPMRARVANAIAVANKRGQSLDVYLRNNTKLTDRQIKVFKEIADNMPHEEVERAFAKVGNINLPHLVAKGALTPEQATAAKVVFDKYPRIGKKIRVSLDQSSARVGNIGATEIYEAIAALDDVDGSVILRTGFEDFASGLQKMIIKEIASDKKLLSDVVDETAQAAVDFHKVVSQIARNLGDLRYLDSSPTLVFLKNLRKEVQRSKILSKAEKAKQIAMLDNSIEYISKYAQGNKLFGMIHEFAINNMLAARITFERNLIGGITSVHFLQPMDRMTRAILSKLTLNTIQSPTSVRGALANLLVQFGELPRSFRIGRRFYQLENTPAVVRSIRNDLASELRKLRKLQKAGASEAVQKAYLKGAVIRATYNSVLRKSKRLKGDLRSVVEESLESRYHEVFRGHGRRIPGKVGKVLNTPVRALVGSDAYLFNQSFKGHKAASQIDKAIKEGRPLRSFRDIKLSAKEITEAREDALYYLFRSSTPVDSISRNQYLSFFAPFLKTRYNLLRFAVDSTPFGMIKAVTRGMRARKLGKKGIALDSKAMARAINGTILAASLSNELDKRGAEIILPSRNRGERQHRLSLGVPEVGIRWKDGTTTNVTNLSPLSELVVMAGVGRQGMKDLKSTTIPKNRVLPRAVQSVYRSIIESALYSDVKGMERLMRAVFVEKSEDPESQLSENAVEVLKRAFMGRAISNLLRESGRTGSVYGFDPNKPFEMGKLGLIIGTMETRNVLGAAAGAAVGLVAGAALKASGKKIERNPNILEPTSDSFFEGVLITALNDIPNGHKIAQYYGLPFRKRKNPLSGDPIKLKERRFLLSSKALPFNPDYYKEPYAENISAEEAVLREELLELGISMLPPRTTTSKGIKLKKSEVDEAVRVMAKDMRMMDALVNLVNSDFYQAMTVDKIYYPVRVKIVNSLKRYFYDTALDHARKLAVDRLFETEEGRRTLWYNIYEDKIQYTDSERDKKMLKMELLRFFVPSPFEKGFKQ